MHIVRPLILRSLMSFLELSKLQGCVLKYSNHELWSMTGLAWQHCCWATCQIYKQLEYFKYQSHPFCYWLKINSTMAHYEIIASLSFLTTSVRTTQLLHGPPSDPVLMVRWGTQDFRLTTALKRPWYLKTLGSLLFWKKKKKKKHFFLNLLKICENMWGQGLSPKNK